jgi:hypothetical protein
VPITTTSGYAADGRPESPRPYGSGKELATPRNADLAKPTGDLDDQRDKGK